MERKIVKRKTRVLVGTAIIIFTLLVSRLAYLQLFQVEKFKTLAQQNHMRLIQITAPRGEIYARDGKTKIVGNKPVYTVSLMYLGLKNTNQVLQRVADVLKMPVKDIQQKLDDQKLRLYQPVNIATNVPLETVLEIEQHRLEMPGVLIDVQPIRTYPHESLAAHVVGYVQQIQEKQLEKMASKGYSLGDNVGQSGLEYEYEDYLRGQAGARQVEVDAEGRPVRDLGISKAVPGDNMVLNLDYKLQAAAEKALESQVNFLQSSYSEADFGAVVAMDIHTGQVLAMASYPTYDPSAFTKRLSQSEVDELYDQRLMRFINRSLTPYPPGSTFKMAVAAAGLQSGDIDPNYSIFDPGYLIVDNHRFNNWALSGNGNVDVRKALQVSCDTYFYYFGLKMGDQEIVDMAKQFGLGRKLGLDLPGEQSGILPEPEVKYNLYKQYLSQTDTEKLKTVNDKYEKLIAAATTEQEIKKLKTDLFNERMQINYDLCWHNYDTVISSIGQGINKYSMLQLADYVAAIANGGTLYRPQLVKQIVDYQGKVVKKYQPEILNKVKISSENLEIIKDGMKMVTGPGGTASSLFQDIPVKVAAKSGTAEVFGRPNHGLMVAFAPADKPEIAVASIIEYSGHATSGGGPIVHDVLANYFGVQAAGSRSGGGTE